MLELTITKLVEFSSSSTLGDWKWGRVDNTDYWTQLLQCSSLKECLLSHIHGSLSHTSTTMWCTTTPPLLSGICHIPDIRSAFPSLLLLLFSLTLPSSFLLYSIPYLENNWNLISYWNEDLLGQASSSYKSQWAGSLCIFYRRKLYSRNATVM